MSWVKFAAAFGAVTGAVIALIALWTQSDSVIPQYIKILGTSILAFVALLLYVSFFFVKKSEIREDVFKR